MDRPDSGQERRIAVYDQLAIASPGQAILQRLDHSEDVIEDTKLIKDSSAIGKNDNRCPDLWCDFLASFKNHKINIAVVKTMSQSQTRDRTSNDNYTQTISSPSS